MPSSKLLLLSLMTGVAAAAPSPLVAQTDSSALIGRDRWADSARREIEAAAIVSDLERLREAGALVERALTVYADDALLQHYRAYALYREATLLQASRRTKDARPLLEEADEFLERSARSLAMPETHALRSAVLGQLIGTNPIRGMVLGPRSSGAMDRAVAMGPRNPRVWLLRGIGAMFTPAAFGGGTERAEESLRRALELFATDAPVPPAPAWGHAEAYAWLGQTLREQGRLDEARYAYARALELEPGYTWVSRHLLPALERGGR